MEKTMDNTGLTENEIKHLPGAMAVIGSIVVAVILVIVACLLPSKAHAGEGNDLRIQTAILYAESASDPQGWVPKMNTYHKARRSGESLTQTMKRVSSAYRTRSRQYQKAINNDLNAYEKKVYQRVQNAVYTFQPVKGWKYAYHENLALYASEKAAMAHLKRVWGKSVDFASAVKIGQEHYFAES